VQFTRSDEIGSVYHNALYRLRAFDMTKYQDKMKIEIYWNLTAMNASHRFFSSKPTLVLFSTAHLHPIKSLTQEDI